MGAYEAGVRRGLQDHGIDTDAAPLMVVPRMPSDIRPGYHIEVNGNWESVQQLIVETKWCRVQVLDHWFALDATIPVAVKTQGRTDAEMNAIASRGSVSINPGLSPDRVTTPARNDEACRTAETIIRILNKNESGFVLPNEGLDGDLIECEVSDLEVGHYVKNNDAWTLVTFIGRESQVTIVGLKGYPERLVVPNQGPVLEVFVAE